MTLTMESLAAQALQARIGLSEDKLAQLLPELNAVLKNFDALNQIDTAGVEPLVSVLNLNNIMRPDEVQQSFSRTQLLANAPKATDEAFVVPKTVE